MATFVKVCIVISALLLAACAPAAPTVAPTKPPPTAAPAAAPTKPAAAPTAAPTAAPKPAAPTATPAPKVKRGGTMVLGENNHPASLDPIFEPSAPPLSELGAYEALVRHEVTDLKAGKLELKPELAESWQQVDPKTLVLKLRRGIKFHDGSDFNAEAAKWSLERMGSHAKSLSKSLAANYASLEVVDPYTLRISYKAASALSLLYLTPATGGTGSGGTHIVSKAEWDKVGEAAFALRPSGTGPMKVVDWKRDSEIIVGKFDGYWKKGVDDKPLPYLDGLRSRLIRDTAVHHMELKAGTIHITRRAVLGAQDLPTVKANPELEIMVWGWAPNRMYFGYNDQKETFGKNLKLRQASQYAVDRESMAKVLAGDAGMPNYYLGWVPAWSGYDDKLPRYTFDLNKATALVKEAGYPNGVDILFLHENTTTFRKIGEMVQAMLGKASIRITLEAQERTANRAKIKAGEFEANIYNLGASPDPAFFNRGFTCEGSANWSNYCNKEVDKCMFDAMVELDAQKRADLYKKCQRLMYEDALVAGLYMDPSITVYRKEVKGVMILGAHEYLGEAWLDK